MRIKGVRKVKNFVSYVGNAVANSSTEPCDWQLYLSSIEVLLSFDV